MTGPPPRVVLVLPGRGSYGPSSLGSLQLDHPLIEAAEQLRDEAGLPSLRAIDAASAFDPALHLRPENAAPLTLVTSLLDAETAMRDHEVVGVVGNSLGWYTALAVSEALPFRDAFRLVSELARLQEQFPPEGGTGGQVVYPLSDREWQPDAELRRAVSAVLEGDAGEGRIFESVELGGYAVLAGDDAGVARLLRELPPLAVGERQYPLRLALHGPYHTPLMAGIAEVAPALLADLDWTRPAITLIDGEGRRWSPFAGDPGALRDYTLGHQLTHPYRFATSVRVALRELAPDLLVLTGPGNSLGGVCGQLVVAEGYRGLRSRRELEIAQSGRRPMLLSMRR
jgi:[acyl-carrier-protein] S-malonyltransferase